MPTTENIYKQFFHDLSLVIDSQQILTSKEDRIAYSYDATRHQVYPLAVIKPKSTDQISELVKLANQYQIPITPRGSGTGLSGGAVPVKGGIALAFDGYDKVIDIDKTNLVAIVEPGLVTAQLQKLVEGRGLFYPPDPSSAKVSTIGGNVAEGAGGPRALKYGVTRDYVIGLEIVLPDGEIITTGGLTVKNVSGYDLTRLIVASEGTLAIITKVILKLIPKPEAAITYLATFEKLEQAAQASTEIVRQGLLPTALEIMDNPTIRAVEDYAHLNLDKNLGAVLIIELDGFKLEVERQSALLQKIISGSGARDLHSATEDLERNRLWAARQNALPALARISPSVILEDATVPRRQVPIMIKGINEIAKKYDLTIGTFGHAGDGNLHPTIVTDLRDEEKKAAMERAIEEIFSLALKCGGTLTGEHGIGLVKSKFLSQEVGTAGFEAMRKIKQAWDPGNILNPGKIFATE
jgi:glycolate oxidase